MKAVEPSEIIDPAVNGTLSVLKAAHTHGGSVRRVVVLSSTAAVFRVPPDGQPVVLDESAWNEQAIATIKEKGRDADAVTKYRASKTLAERAAWDWWNEKKAAGVVGWDLVVLNPPFVYGPVIHDVDKPENLNESVRDWYHYIVKGQLDDNARANNGYVIPAFCGAFRTLTCLFQCDVGRCARYCACACPSAAQARGWREPLHHLCGTIQVARFW